MNAFLTKEKEQEKKQELSIARSLASRALRALPLPVGQLSLVSAQPCIGHPMLGLVERLAHTLASLGTLLLI